ncbi:MFS transporter [Lactiplantibacillus pentosus]|uniref:MFS transporter n=1 Tax=Lactiplantibacillus pentosus TaxID=1589 RepID=A0AB37RJW9_LACPE|nr:MFS transporter [Lactiplantibacillus pentosus]RMW43638.1 MFS transporter [Lactiplantibacillus pentosus]RMW45820.1 MFS transporter [Lactiplantibacillus pentosus]RMW54037.1 MFS transporter [Lactiplantibacillus pentosus]RMW54799.1 MFS transporter [Lactiplantibacillus pentosus]
MNTVSVKQLASHKLLWVIGTAWLFDALDVALLSFIMPVIKQSWHLTAGQLGAVSAVTSLGMMIGALGCGYLADKFGRKPVLIGTLLLFSIGNLLLTVTPSVGWFIAVRLITGIGLGGELPVAATTIADHYRGTQRSRMLVLVDSFWAIGWIAASLLSFLVMPMIGWRLTVLITALMGLYALGLRRHLPAETTEAGAPSVERVAFGEALRRVWSPTHRRATICLSVLWFVIMFTYYGMFLWLPSVLVLRGFSLVHGFGYTLLMSLAQLPGYYLAAWLIGVVSRKAVLTTYLIGTMVSAAAFGLANNPTMIIISGAWLSFFTLGAWGIMIAFTPGQFPADIRGMGMGSAQSIGRIGATIGPFLIGALMTIGFTIPAIFMVFVGVLIVGIVVLIWGLTDQDA